MRIKRGFTLVELSLSLVFIAILSLTVAYIISDTITSYRRGITLKQVNTVGMDLVDDIRAAIQNSSTKSVKDDCRIVYGGSWTGSSAITSCENDGANNFVVLKKSSRVKRKGKLQINIPVYGAFCTGTYSYIWNSGYFFNGNDEVLETDKAEFKFKGNNIEENEICKKSSFGGIITCKNFRLLKIRDESRATCVAAAGDRYNVSNIGNIFDITRTSENVSEEPIDLLASDETDGGLAVYDLSVFGPAESMAKNTMFYATSFILGTIQGGADITKSGGFCAAPDDYENENFDYCSINKFNFATEATGGRG